MKKLLAVVLLAFALASPARAVDVTITLTDAQLTRIKAACGDKLNLRDGNGQPRACTNAEARQQLIDFTKDMTRAYERRVAEAAALAAVSVTEMSIQ